MKYCLFIDTIFNMTERLQKTEHDDVRVSYLLIDTGLFQHLVYVSLLNLKNVGGNFLTNRSFSTSTPSIM